MQQRVACRRDQVRAAWRAAKAADDVYAVCGGNAIRRDKPVLRFWRGMHAGLHHGIFVAGGSTTAPPVCSWASRRRGPPR
jgi:3-hydroxy-9,10-secoandrosta-1,3,5(10)-triene-9,17-dione monooxygenase